ncbi:amidase [Prauserella flavalba]|uniref:Amidase n=1 Tax=Prauserella flavalba TaxID=1477506 RepID=A0A318LAW3_9PSEU|nr:amidase [Prauserella flavalba]PXY18400.1 amidase [Prauserella flavalba]
MPEPVYRPIRQLTAEFRAGTLSPVELLEDVLARIEEFDGTLHAYVTVVTEQAREQAAEATAAYRRGESAPLLGVPLSVKDAFHVKGVETTLGSLVHRGQIAPGDSGVVRRLRAAGSVFTGKTNTAEFGQSATTDNLLGDDTANPWDPARTPGGSSGGAAASVAAGLAVAAVGSDGGGSIRIPAAFCGLVGVKPTLGRCRDEGGFRAMTDFVSPGPLAWRVDDARVILEVLAGRRYPRGMVPRPLRIAWCANPEHRPVDPGVAAAVARVAQVLEAQGHLVEERDLPVAGWQDVFGPLVLADERAERGHLLAESERITEYQRATLRAAAELDPATVTSARRALPEYRARVAALFDEVDLVLTPATAVPPFPLRQRPREIAGEPVGALWGAFPFAVPFNVAGTPAVTIPCGTVEGLPVAAQLVGGHDREGLLLDVAEELESAVEFDRDPVLRRWDSQSAAVR